MKSEKVISMLLLLIFANQYRNHIYTRTHTNSKERIQLLLRYNTPLNDHGHSLALKEALQRDDFDHIEFLIQNKAVCDLNILEIKMNADCIMDLFPKLNLPNSDVISKEDEEEILSEESKRRLEISKYLWTCFENKLERERRELQSQDF